MAAPNFHRGFSGNNQGYQARNNGNGGGYQQRGNYNRPTRPMVLVPPIEYPEIPGYIRLDPVDELGNEPWEWPPAVLEVLNAYKGDFVGAAAEVKRRKEEGTLTTVS